MTATTIDDEHEDDPRLAEVVAIYARTVVDVRHCAQGAYTIGDARRATFPLLSPILPDPHNFPLLCWTDHALALRFTADMRGELVEGNRRSSLAELIASGRATPIDGAFTVELAPGARGVVALEHVRFELRSVPAPDRTRVADRSWWPHVALLYLVLYGLLALFLLRPHFADTLTSATDRPARAEQRRIDAPAALLRRGGLALAEHSATRTLARVIALVPTIRRVPPPTGWSDAAARYAWGLRDPDLDLHPAARATDVIAPLAPTDHVPAADLRPVDRPTALVASRGPADVRRILTARAPILRRCGALGTASVHFTINSAGLVTAVVVAADRPREARVAHCVAGELRRTWFPRGVGNLRATYPLPPADREISRVE